jgi:hypothetical protein|tara:strand:+ start:289 stop:504 length:216 start_codon:yes stop_codon:yes gene_type:complete
MDLNSQQKMRINLQDADDVACDECENTYFSPAIIIKRVSALLSPTGQEMMAPVQLFQCNKCGHVNKEFLPE